MNEPLNFVMRLVFEVSLKTKRRRPIIIVSEVHRVGQRYTEMSPTILGGVFKPEYVFTIKDVKQCPSLESAKRFIQKQAKANQQVLPDFQFFHHPTFTGSVGGPGFYPLNSQGGPLYAIVADANLNPLASTLPPLQLTLPIREMR